MATNEWAAGYLEALIESSALVTSQPQGGGTGTAVVGVGDGDKSSFNAADMKGQSSIAIRYFLNEITGFSEEQLHRTWMRTTVMKDVGDRGSRLENFCWRIWHLSRKKRQLKLEAASRLEQRREEQREVENDLRQEMGDLESKEWDEAAEGEDSRRPSSARPSDKATGSAAIPSVAEDAKPEQAKAIAIPGAEGQPRRLYIVMISLHGLIRGENMELGRDSDTGGQVKYVVEYARALATMPSVYRVDLLTRQITDPEVDYSYGEPLEMLSTGTPGADGDIALGESAGAYIVRIPCGPTHKYLRKEVLWPFVPEFVENALGHISRMARVLKDEVGDGHPVWPYVIHGHYADAGDAAALLSGALNVPMVLTGHSLGRNKLEQLLKQGRMSMEEIVEQYSILRRIEGEEFALDAAELVVTSTRQEVDDQWGLYDGFDVRLERVLRLRQRQGLTCHGRYMPRMVVIPPGMDFSNVVVPSIGEEELAPGPEAAVPQPPDAQEPAIYAEIRRFFSNPAKPMILALARPDPKKNLAALVKAYGTSPQLRELANLTLIMGNRDDIDEMPAGNADVLLTVLKLVDRYDLYGLVAYPKHHKQSDVSHIYALAAKSKGVFVNPALVEPFGLTLIEAAARGLPMVATKNGGPVDIQKMLNNGILVDPHDEVAIGRALLELVSDRQKWLQCRRSALDNIHRYAWPQHCAALLARLQGCRMRQPTWHAKALFDALGAPEGLHQMTLSDSISSFQDLSLRMSMDAPANAQHFHAFANQWAQGSYTGTAADWHQQQLSQGLQSQANGNTSQGTGPHGHHAGTPPPPGALDESDPAILVSNRAASSSAFVAAGRGALNGGTPLASPGTMVRVGGSMRLGKRRHLTVVAVDEYNVAGHPGPAMGTVIKAAIAQLQAQSKQGPMGGISGSSTGLAVATALSARELLAYLRGAGIPLEHIDVVVASGGSAVYYSVPVAALDPEGPASGIPRALSTNAGLDGSLEDGKGWQLVPDPDYFLHIEYRWSAEAVRRSLPRVLSSAGGSFSASSSWNSGSASAAAAAATATAAVGDARSPGADQRSGADPPLGSLKGVPAGVLQALVEDELHSTPRCLAYRVLHADKMPSLSLLRKRLRLRGLRLHLVYCRSVSSLLVLPLHASRAQALRYLFVRWDLDVAKMNVVMLRSDASDSDAPQLLSGAHRTVLLEGGKLSSSALSETRLQLLNCVSSMATATELPNVEVVSADDGAWGQALLKESAAQH